jgi:hypothetical protein
MDEYFVDAGVVLHTKDGAQKGRLTGSIEDVPGPFKHYLLECGRRVQAELGDVAVWDVGAPEVVDGCCTRRRAMTCLRWPRRWRRWTCCARGPGTTCGCC